MEFIHINDEDELEILVDLTKLINKNNNNKKEGQNLGS
jgi:hypothetical protein